MEEVGVDEETDATKRDIRAQARSNRKACPRRLTSRLMSDRSRKIAKPAAALGVLATMASIWWFALRPRRKIKPDQ